MTPQTFSGSRRNVRPVQNERPATRDWVLLLSSTPRLTTGARLLLVLLTHLIFAYGTCRVSERRLAEMLGVSKRTVKRWQRELVSRQLIEVQRRGWHRANEYRTTEWVWEKVRRFSFREYRVFSLRQPPRWVAGPAYIKQLLPRALSRALS